MKRFKAYFEVAGSMLVFGTIGVVRKSVPFSSGLLAFIRGILGGFALWLISLIKGEKVFTKKPVKNLLFLFFSGALIGFNWILLFEAYNYTSVSVATLCYYMQPTIVILLSPILLKEKLTAKKTVCAFLSVLGMCAVSGVFNKGGVGAVSTKGILFGLGAAFLYACVVISNKMFSSKIVDVNSSSGTVVRLLSASVVLLPYLILSGGFSELADITSVSPAVIGAVLCLGILHTGISYAMYFSGMGGLKGQTVAVLSYIDPVSALILSAVILHENIGIFGILGSVLIIGSALVSELKITIKAD